GDALALALGALQSLQQRRQLPAIGRRAAAVLGGRGLDQAAALFQLQRDRLPRAVLLGEVAAPGREEVAPGDQGEFVEAVLLERRLVERRVAAPAIVVEEHHRRFDPGAGVTALPA